MGARLEDELLEQGIGHGQVEHPDDVTVGHHEPVLLGETAVGVVVLPLERVCRLHDQVGAAVLAAQGNQLRQHGRPDAPAAQVRVHPRADEAHVQVVGDTREGSTRADDLVAVHRDDRVDPLTRVGVGEDDASLLQRPDRGEGTLEALGGLHDRVEAVELTPIVGVQPADLHTSTVDT
nr:hypothetical protein [Tetrasphaera sp. HKS02]